MKPQIRVVFAVSSLFAVAWSIASADAGRGGAVREGAVREGPARKDAAADTARLRGTWRCASAVVNGKALPEASVKKLKLTLTPERYKTERADEVLFDSTYRLDAKHTPRHIDMVGTEGEATGKVAPGIYSVSKDGKRQVLKICYVMPGGERPTAFESGVGSHAFFITWERDEPAGGKRADK
jgi:uncharacterized protein (TIGR03067 family)